MAKAKVPRIYFYAGVVLNRSRETNLLFDGIWVDDDNLPFDQIRQNIKGLQAANNSGLDVALTALTILQE